MLAALTSLGVALQAVAQSVQQLGDHRVADAVAQTVERHRQRPCALARPPQRRVGIAGGGRLNQRIQIAQQRRVEIDRALAAAARPSRPAARERLVRRQFTQTALDGRCRDTCGSGDQRRAAITDRLGLSRRHTRRDRSVSTGASAACFARRVANSTGAAYYSPINSTSSYFLTGS